MIQLRHRLGFQLEALRTPLLKQFQELAPPFSSAAWRVDVPVDRVANGHPFSALRQTRPDAATSLRFQAIQQTRKKSLAPQGQLFDITHKRHHIFFCLF